MKIEPIYTLMLNEGDEYISCEEEVKIVDCNNEPIMGIFKSCDNEDLWIEIGTDESNLAYILFDEIETIEII
jgi:hypothetical protein